MSVYNFQQAIEDGATVPLYYENRIPNYSSVTPTSMPNFRKLVDDADLDDETEKKL